MNTPISDNLRGVERWLFTKAKRLTFWGLFSRLVSFGVAVAGVFVTEVAPFAPYIVVGLVVVGAVLDHYAEGNRSAAEGILRRLDFESGFDWKISDSERADLLVKVSASTRQKQLTQNQNLGSYFDTKKTFGALKAVENIEESAWWTKHLSQKIQTMYGWMIGVVSLGSVASLIFAVILVSSLPQVPLTEVARVVTAVVGLVVNLGLVRFWISYGRLHTRATTIEGQARKLREGNPSEAEAVKLYAEYHLARASSPTIPDAIWQWNKKHLNQIWQQTLTNR